MLKNECRASDAGVLLSYLTLPSTFRPSLLSLDGRSDASEIVINVDTCVKSFPIIGVAHKAERNTRTQSRHG